MPFPNPAPGQARRQDGCNERCQRSFAFLAFLAGHSAGCSHRCTALAGTPSGLWRLTNRAVALAKSPKNWSYSCTLSPLRCEQMLVLASLGECATSKKKEAKESASQGDTDEARATNVKHQRRKGTKWNRKAPAIRRRTRTRPNPDGE